VSVQTRDRTEALDVLAQSFRGALAAMRRMRGRETHNPVELSYAQYGLLFRLADGKPLSTRELALAADVSPATATEMLDCLAAAGLVERKRSEHDKRVVFTSLTARGNALTEERRARYEPLWRAAMSGYTEEELQTAAAVLDSVRRMFDEFVEEHER
jgi:DNA-binding MarR family transcriptional regulator